MVKKQQAYKLALMDIHKGKGGHDRSDKLLEGHEKGKEGGKKSSQWVTTDKI